MGVVEVVRLELGGLVRGRPVRLGPVDERYVGVLAASFPDWPPVVVRREDLSVVDGWYRCLAARELGHTEIVARFFEGSAEEAYVEALRWNLHHGLPLSLRDREEAARRVLVVSPQWSDRRVAEVSGLAPGTVGRLRAALGCATVDLGQLVGRLGRDGRCRPVDPVAVRQRIVAALRECPDESLRGIARRVGVSPATVRAVRVGLERVEGGVVEGVSGGEVVVDGGLVEGGGVDRELLALVGGLSGADPAMVSVPGGREFCGWFARTEVGDDWVRFVGVIPASRTYEVADEARRRAKEWLDFATCIEERIRNRQTPVLI